ncbi:MAG: hypothetical protein RL199_164 [Pseudomonadota bacterium]
MHRSGTVEPFCSASVRVRALPARRASTSLRRQSVLACRPTTARTAPSAALSSRPMRCATARAARTHSSSVTSRAGPQSSPSTSRRMVAAAERRRRSMLWLAFITIDVSTGACGRSCSDFDASCLICSRVSETARATRRWSATAGSIWRTTSGGRCTGRPIRPTSSSHACRDVMAAPGTRRVFALHSGEAA